MRWWGGTLRTPSTFSAGSFSAFGSLSTFSTSVSGTLCGYTSSRAFLFLAKLASRCAVLPPGRRGRMRRRGAGGGPRHLGEIHRRQGGHPRADPVSYTHLRAHETRH